MDIKSYIISAIVALIIGVITFEWNSNKKRFTATLTGMVQQMEVAVQGSSMGAEKKKMLIQMLEVNGISMTAKISNEIDAIVKALNDNQAWITKFMGNGTANAQSATETAVAVATQAAVINDIAASAAPAETTQTADVPAIVEQEAVPAQEATATDTTNNV